MGERIKQTQQGNTVIVWFYTYDEGENLADLDSLPTVECWKASIQVLGPFEMQHYGVGVYRYELDTTQMSDGEYRLVCRGVLQGKNVVQDTVLTVVKPWQSS